MNTRAPLPETRAPRTQRAAAHGGSAEAEGAVRPDAPHAGTVSVHRLMGKRVRLLIVGHRGSHTESGWDPKVTALQWALLHRAS